MWANPRAEAFDRLGGRYEVRVLEPSPPAVDVPPWFADDPVARGEVPPGRQVVSPVGTGDLRWEELADGEPSLTEWCEERWLGPCRRLEAVPSEFVKTRASLHVLAQYVISPARQRVNGKIGLRFTRGGFGTPFFGENVQVRVELDQLVVVRGDDVHLTPITSLEAAANEVDVEVDGDAEIEVEPSACASLSEWFGFGASVLEELRASVGEQSRVQLWPEHFDIALEHGSRVRGARATYGASPGDEHHPEPYLYVAPWDPPEPGELWRATGFAGAELPYSLLLDADVQRAAALEFFRRRVTALGA